jgi:DNA-binding Lrp family transcriptional regulator
MWRDHLPIHPAAELFPLMSPDELRALGEDIKKNGLKSPIALWATGDNETHDEFQLLDGRNRLDAMELVGLQTIKKNDKGKYQLDPCLTGHSHLQTGGPAVIYLHAYEKSMSFRLGGGKMKVQRRPDTDPYAYVISANIHRRHLTAEQKRELIAKLLRAMPEKSNRQIAKQVKASHPHVAKVRAELEKTGDVETVSTSIDTKGRKQPAKRKAVSSKAAAHAYYRKMEQSAAKPEHKAPIAIDIAPGEYQAPEHEDQDIVERALQLVRQMDAEQRRRFISKLEVTYGAVVS